MEKFKLNTYGLNNLLTEVFFKTILNLIKFIFDQFICLTLLVLMDNIYTIKHLNLNRHWSFYKNLFIDLQLFLYFYPVFVEKKIEVLNANKIFINIQWELCTNNLIKTKLTIDKQIDEIIF